MGDGIRLRHRRPGEEVVHVWNKYEQIVQYGYREEEYAPEQNLVKERVRVGQGDTFFIATSYSFDQATGLFTLNNPQSFTYDQLLEDEYDAYHPVRHKSRWKAVNASSANKISYGVGSGGTVSGSTYFEFYPETVKQSVLDTSIILNITKGNYIEQVKSNNGSAFPQNSYQNGYWYVYSHSYKK